MMNSSCEEEDNLTCEHCKSKNHVKNDCPILKTVAKYQSHTKRSYGNDYQHYDIPVYDTHCHLDYVFDRFHHSGTSMKDFISSQYFPANYKGCICSFSDLAAYSSFGIWRELLDQDNVWGTFGMHPHRAQCFNDSIELKMLEYLQHPKAIAVGECGLDYSLRNDCPIDVQTKVFIKHIEIAKKTNKPLVIHSRQAEDDVYDLLCEHDMEEWPIHIHCFTGSHSQLHKFVNAFRNMFFGFTNLVSYPTAGNTHEVAKSIPLDRVLLETDAPYFIPTSLRDTEKFSHPGNVIFVAEAIAEIKGCDVEKVLENCRRNVRKIYKI